MSIESSPHAKKRLKMRGINEKALYARKVRTLEVVFMKIKYYPDSDILEIRVLDEKPKYGEEYDENIIIHYSEENRVVKIEILDASKAILRFLQPILEQKPIKGIVEAQ